MDEKMIEISFGIIAFAGDAKSTAKQAINEAKKENFEKAKELLKEADKIIVNAHKKQTELIQSEARGEKNEISVVLIHSQDHLMTTMNYLGLAKEIVDMYEYISQKLDK